MKHKFIASAFITLMASTSAMAAVSSFTDNTNSIGITGSFSQTVTVTTGNDYLASKGTVYIQGLSGQFSDLAATFYDTTTNYSSFTGLPVDLTKPIPTYTKVTFADNAVSTIDLVANHTYNIVITGNNNTKDALLNVKGLYFSGYSNGTVTPVPEPESYAMFLAGLGLMGAIAKRRKSKQA